MHGQYDSIIFPKTFFSESRVIIRPLQGDLIKNKEGVALFQISQKERLFHL